MDPNFWQKKWEAREIGFHEPEPNPHLLQHFPSLGLAPGRRVFVPLCGATRDIGWLLRQGYRVAGAELVELAVRELFDELRVKPTVTALGSLQQFSAPGLDVFQGDVFDLNRLDLGRVLAVYVRAALVALPPSRRAAYTRHLRDLAPNTPQLLLTFDYPQEALKGPPFSVPAEEVQRHYAATHTVNLLASLPVGGGLKGQVPAKELIWHLTPKTP